MRKVSGHTVTEYGIIGGLVVVVSIGALGALGRALTGQYHGLKQAAGTESLLTPTQAKIPAPETPKAGMAMAVVMPAMKALPVINPISAVSNTETYQAVAQTVQTVGANGTTNMLASRLTALAQQKLAEGKISQTQANQLTALANHGHQMAKQEAAIEAVALNPRIAGKQLQDYKVTFEGQRTTVHDLVTGFGFTQDYKVGLLSNPLDSANFAGKQMKTFLNQYQQAVTSGALNDPETSKTVKMLASQIATVADTVVFAVGDRANNKISSEEFTGNMANRLENYSASTSTHEDSAGICTVGNGNDTGTNCSGQ